MPAVGAMSGGSLAFCAWEKLVRPNLPPPPGPRPHKPFRARLGPRLGPCQGLRPGGQSSEG
jgi:hypothetical protein